MPIDVAGHQADDILLGKDTDSAAFVYHQRRQGVGISHAGDDVAHRRPRVHDEIRLDREDAQSGIMGSPWLDRGHKIAAMGFKRQKEWRIGWAAACPQT